MWLWRYINIVFYYLLFIYWLCSIAAIKKYQSPVNLIYIIRNHFFMWRVSLLVINAKHWSWISLHIIKHDPVCVISDRMDEKHTFLLHFCYKNVLKCDLITCNSLQNIKITPEMHSPYPINPKTWCHSSLYYFWFPSYDSGLLRRAPSWICPIWPPQREPSLAP